MKKILLLALTTLSSGALMAQSAMDGFSFSQSDLKGTARFMSMGGAFGALGADLSVLGQNPGGIGVYRSSEIGFTLELDAQRNTAESQNLSYRWDKTPFYLNNIGFISTFRMDGTLKNFNIGFTYNRSVSFNRRFRGVTPHLNNSMSNYIAGIANNYGITENMVSTTSGVDPYNPPIGQEAAPWITILGYDSRLISPENQGNNTSWYGQWGDGTSGKGTFEVYEKGAVNEFNIAFGGNFNNVVYWGMNFGIIDMDYRQGSYWEENLQNAYVVNRDNQLGRTSANWGLENYYHVNGTGFNYKLGLIIKPVQELRLGIAMHTPTWYSIEENYIASVGYNYGNDLRNGSTFTNDGYYAGYDYRFRTPWRFIVSAAGVLGRKFIISADYEFANYSFMHFTDKYDEDPWYDSEETYRYTNQDIKDYYQTQSTLRIGAEYRITPEFSIRAGYSYVSSPVKTEVRDNKVDIYTAGTRMGYTFDDETNYLCAGIGYRHKSFYLDAAYVYKHRSGTYHPYAVDVYNPDAAPSAKVTNVNNQVVLSMGFKF